MQVLSWKRFYSRSVGSALICLAAATGVWGFEEYKSGKSWPTPVVVTPGSPGTAPADAIVLFDGTNLDAWDGVKNWELKDGYAVAGSYIKTKQKFADCQLHLEFATPEKLTGKGQERGNNGAYFMERYEVQILDSYENETYPDGQCGAIYKQSPPLVNACRKPGEWQTYDIIFKAPRFNEDGSLKSPATITAFQNGILIQDHFVLEGGTAWDKPPTYTRHPERVPFALYYHGNPVRFRNIWIRDLMPKAGT